jgi:hypothetical protein
MLVSLAGLEVDRDAVWYPACMQRDSNDELNELDDLFERLSVIGSPSCGLRVPARKQ